MCKHDATSLKKSELTSVYGGDTLGFSPISDEVIEIGWTLECSCQHITSAFHRKWCNTLAPSHFLPIGLWGAGRKLGEDIVYQLHLQGFQWVPTHGFKPLHASINLRIHIRKRFSTTFKKIRTAEMLPFATCCEIAGIYSVASTLEPGRWIDLAVKHLLCMQIVPG